MFFCEQLDSGKTLLISKENFLFRSTAYLIITLFITDRNESMQLEILSFC